MPDLYDIANIRNDDNLLKIGPYLTEGTGDWTVPYIEVTGDVPTAQPGTVYLNGTGSNPQMRVSNFVGYGRVDVPTVTGGGLKVISSDGETLICGNIIVSQNWITPTFLNGWVNYDTTFNQCGYFKDKFGIVHLRGLVKSGTMGAAVFKLPAGYRPSHRCLFQNQSVGAPGRVDVLPTGEVNAQSGANGWISLDSLSFRAA